MSTPTPDQKPPTGWRKAASTAGQIAPPILLVLLTASVSIGGIAYGKLFDRQNEDIQGLRDDVTANGTAIDEFKVWQAETTANRWTSANQAAFQETLFEQLAAERKECSDRWYALLEKLHHHEENDHPPPHVKERLDRIETKVDRVYEEIRKVNGKD